MAGVEALEATELGQATLSSATGKLEELLEFDWVPGLSRTERLTNLAFELGGSTDKKSKAYKRARRQAERMDPSPAQRKKGRKPSRPKPPTLKRLRASRSRQDQTVRDYRRVGAAMKALVRRYGLSRRERVEWLPPHEWVHISRPVMIRVTNLLGERRSQEAFDALWEGFLDGYDVPAGEGWGEDDLEVVEIKLIPGGGRRF